MQIFTETIKCKDEELQLTNQRALFWNSRDMLVLSDLHIGKTAHFRKSGIPISSEVLQNDLKRLDHLILHFNAKTLMVVGDLFHAELNEDVHHFKNWMQKHKVIKIILVKGNHDKSSFELYEDLNIEVQTGSVFLNPFVFVHHPKKIKDDTFYISGHTHPGISIRGKGKQRIKLPCFQVTNHQLILPAFSLFTGLNTQNAPEMCVNYAFTDLSIFKV